MLATGIPRTWVFQAPGLVDVENHRSGILCLNSLSFVLASSWALLEAFSIHNRYSSGVCLRVTVSHGRGWKPRSGSEKVIPVCGGSRNNRGFSLGPGRGGAANRTECLIPKWTPHSLSVFPLETFLKGNWWEFF